MRSDREMDHLRSAVRRLEQEFNVEIPTVVLRETKVSVHEEGKALQRMLYSANTPCWVFSPWVFNDHSAAVPASSERIKAEKVIVEVNTDG